MIQNPTVIFQQGEFQISFDRDHYHLDIELKDRRDIVWLISLCLAMNDVSIHQAKIKRTFDGVFQGHFVVEPTHKKMPVGEVQWKIIYSAFVQALENERNIVSQYQNRIEKIRSIIRKVKIEGIEKTVSLSYDEENKLVVLTVKTLDRPFLLADITEEIFKNGFIIKNARISTEGFQADDILHLECEGMNCSQSSLESRRYQLELSLRKKICY